MPILSVFLNTLIVLLHLLEFFFFFFRNFLILVFLDFHKCRLNKAEGKGGTPH